MTTETVERDFKTTPLEAVMNIATLCSDMGYLGFTPYDQRTDVTGGVYHITIYFKRRPNDGDKDRT
jgi:hypothetical protein